MTVYGVWIYQESFDQLTRQSSVGIFGSPIENDLPDGFDIYPIPGVKCVSGTGLVPVMVAEGVAGDVRVAFRVDDNDLVDPEYWNPTTAGNAWLAYDQAFIPQLLDGNRLIIRAIGEYGRQLTSSWSSEGFSEAYSRLTEMCDEILSRDDVVSDTGIESQLDRPFQIEGLNRSPVTTPAPEYAERVNGLVRVRITVDPQGRIVQRVPLIKGNPGLEQAVMDALHSWRFNPLPPEAPQVNETGVITFRFRLR